MFTTLSETQAAYLAGAIDGEGSIGLHRSGQMKEGRANASFIFRVCVSNTNLAWIHTLQSWAGGQITQAPQIADPARRYRRICYRLQWTRVDAQAMLRQVQPYLLIKREQGQLMLQYFDIAAERRALLTQAGGKFTRTPRAIVAKVQAIYDRLKVLNKRGTPDAPVSKKPAPYQRQCQVAECHAKHYGKGYCRTHYRRYVEHPQRWHERACERCGRRFGAKRSDARFCSKACGDAAGYLRRTGQLSPTAA